MCPLQRPPKTRIDVSDPTFNTWLFKWNENSACPSGMCLTSCVLQLCYVKRLWPTTKLAMLSDFTGSVMLTTASRDSFMLGMLTLNLPSCVKPYLWFSLVIVTQVMEDAAVLNHGIGSIWASTDIDVLSWSIDYSTDSTHTCECDWLSVYITRALCLVLPKVSWDRLRYHEDKHIRIWLHHRKAMSKHQSKIHSS